MKTKTRKELLAEIDALRQRLEKAEETLRTPQYGDTVPLQEITDPKNINETLQHLASLPELNPNPITEVDLDGNVYYLNPAAKQLFPDLQTAGHHHPWLRDLKSLTEMFEHQIKRTHAREVKIGNIWYEQTVYYILEGKRLRIYGLDITESKKAEEALRQSEHREREQAREIATVLDAVPAAVWISHDPNCLHITGNRTADEVLRIPPGAESSLTADAAAQSMHFKVVKDGLEWVGEGEIK